jgi:ABC-type uncharacterized transport system ATPase subunit
MNARPRNSHRSVTPSTFRRMRSAKLQAYSKSNQQKLVLIAALMSREDLLVLDQPPATLFQVSGRICECVAAPRCKR